MINRDCAIIKLLTENDIDARVTMFNYAKVSENPCNGKNAWLEMIKKSIGKKIANSSDEYIISLASERGEIISGKIIGAEIIELIRLLCDNPIPMRITITPAKGNSKIFIFA